LVCSAISSFSVFQTIGVPEDEDELQVISKFPLSTMFHTPYERKRNNFVGHFEDESFLKEYFII